MPVLKEGNVPWEVEMWKSLLVWCLSAGPSLGSSNFGADFWEGDPTKHFSVKKKGVFSEEGGGIQ